MRFHLHQTRNLMGWVLGIATFSPFALYFESPAAVYKLSDVTGRVTYSGRPLNDMTICLDHQGVHSAFGLLEPDGSFRLLNMSAGMPGATPGHYHAHFYGRSEQRALPAKYADPTTSGLEIEIAADWSNVDIELP